MQLQLKEASKEFQSFEAVLRKAVLGSLRSGVKPKLRRILTDQPELEKFPALIPFRKSFSFVLFPGEQDGCRRPSEKLVFLNPETLNPKP